ncbi:MAG: hypothetical protein Q9170_004892 [Blastenia crenularia]
MPPADTPSKSPRHHRRKTRNTSIPQNNGSDLFDDFASRQIKSDPELPEQAMETHPSQTPPRPGPSPHVQGGPVETMEKRRQTPRKNQGARRNGSSPVAKLRSTPQPSHQTQSLTPGKKTNTPSQAYAGPTFHASPAASSLPMPKFFSKSVPEVNKRPSMQSMTEKENAESSSEQSEGSPTPAFAPRISEEQLPEDSPLDFFFKADREQKERQRKEQNPPSSSQNPLKSISDAISNRPYSHHSTNGSLGAVFPIEMESKEPALTSHEQAFSDPTADSVIRNSSKLSTYVEVKETPQQFEQRRAKTLALKKLLLSSVPLESGPDSSHEQASRSDELTPVVSSSQERNGASSSQLHKQIAAQTAQQMSPYPRPASNLRKEVSASALPEDGQTPELPATPTPSRARTGFHSTSTNGGSGPSSNVTQSPASAINTFKRSIGVPNEAAVQTSPYKSMEDDLRRILKLNILPTDDTTSVRS